ncbi:hypothetical protein BTVI_156670 [Pitangus sulphuratus]|nr:hypothetical protein BTVI_156670 [Pitangus sulphuratus]
MYLSPSWYLSQYPVCREISYTLFGESRSEEWRPEVDLQRLRWKQDYPKLWMAAGQVSLPLFIWHQQCSSVDSFSEVPPLELTDLALASGRQDNVPDLKSVQSPQLLTLLMAEEKDISHLLRVTSYPSDATKIAQVSAAWADAADNLMECSQCKPES